MDTQEFKVGGHKVNNLTYADDIVLTAENTKDLQQLMIINMIEEESRKKGLKWNSKKTDVMDFSQ